MEERSFHRGFDIARYLNSNSMEDDDHLSQYSDRTPDSPTECYLALKEFFPSLMKTSSSTRSGLATPSPSEDDTTPLTGTDAFLGHMASPARSGLETPMSTVPDTYGSAVGAHREFNSFCQNFETMSQIPNTIQQPVTHQFSRSVAQHSTKATVMAQPNPMPSAVPAASMSLNVTFNPHMFFLYLHYKLGKGIDLKSLKTQPPCGFQSELPPLAVMARNGLHHYDVGTIKKACVEYYLTRMLVIRKNYLMSAFLRSSSDSTGYYTMLWVHFDLEFSSKSLIELHEFASDIWRFTFRFCDLPRQIVDFLQIDISENDDMELQKMFTTYEHFVVFRNWHKASYGDQTAAGGDVRMSNLIEGQTVVNSFVEKNMHQAVMMPQEQPNENVLVTFDSHATYVQAPDPHLVVYPPAVMPEPPQAYQVAQGVTYVFPDGTNPDPNATYAVLDEGRAPNYAHPIHPSPMVAPNMLFVSAQHQFPSTVAPVIPRPQNLALHQHQPMVYVEVPADQVAIPETQGAALPANRKRGRPTMAGTIKRPRQTSDGFAKIVASFINFDAEGHPSSPVEIECDWRFLIPSAKNLPADLEPSINIRFTYSERKDSDLMLWTVHCNTIYSNIYNVNHESIEADGSSKARTVTHYECKGCKKNKRCNTFRLVRYINENRLTIERGYKVNEHFAECGADYPSDEVRGSKPKDKPEHMLEVLYSDCVRRVTTRIGNGFITNKDQAYEDLFLECRRMLAIIRDVQDALLTPELGDAFEAKLEVILDTSMALKDKKKIVNEQSFGRKLIATKVEAYWCNLIFELVKKHNKEDPHGIAYQVSKFFTFLIAEDLLKKGDAKKQVEKLEELRRCLKFPSPIMWKNLVDTIQKFKKNLSKVRSTTDKNKDVFEIPEWYYDISREDALTIVTTRKQLESMMSVE